MGDQIKWVTSKAGKPVDKGKITGGHEDGNPLYVCRAKRNGNVYPGKYVDHIGAKKVDNGYAVFDGVETRLAEWQIATGDESQFKWVKQVGPFNKFLLLASGSEPVEGGFEVVNDGFDLKKFYIARGTVVADGKDVGVSPGRVSEGSLASVSYMGKEYMSGEYEVLVYAAPPSWLPKNPFPLPDFPIGTGASLGNKSVS